MHIIGTIEGHMQDIICLLSIKELLEESTKEQLTQIAYTKLDSERRKKAQNITNETKRAESIGAGLLLQLGLQQIHKESGNCETTKEKNKHKEETPGAAPEYVAGQGLPLLTVSQVLSKLGEPIEAAYKYGENHKPYFMDIPWYFNLSHSKEYVLCVFSKQEVGVDIQQKRKGSQERILHRFFTKEEQEMWASLLTKEEQRDYFYRIWAAKEAYGKLTGEGIAKAISVNTSPETTEDLGVEWQFYEDLKEYAISICKWKEIKELDTK